MHWKQPEQIEITVRITKEGIGQCGGSNWKKIHQGSEIKNPQLEK